MLPKYTGPCGAAYRLRTKSNTTYEISHPHGTVQVRAGAPFITVNLASPIPSEELRTETWRVTQEALDIHAARTRSALITESGEHDFLTWHQSDSGYHLKYYDTVASNWSITAQLSGETEPPQQLSDFPPHPALRFYRLSQATEDLFDAYRNAYLALECLISSVAIKNRQEKELDWLKRVIHSTYKNAIPPSIDVDALLKAIYEKGRLPLFHAKRNDTFFAPQDAERQHVSQLFGELTLLLTCIFQHQFGLNSIARWGGMSQELQDDIARIALNLDGITFKSKNQIHELPANIQTFNSPRRFNGVWGLLCADGPFKIDEFNEIALSNHGETYITISPEESIPLQNVVQFSLELSIIYQHELSPRKLHKT